MKNRQFIILCIMIVIWFIYLWYKIDKVYDYNEDIHWYIVWSTEVLQDKIDISSEWILKAIYWLD